jgi:hypothetical protein
MCGPTMFRFTIHHALFLTILAATFCGKLLSQDEVERESWRNSCWVARKAFLSGEPDNAAIGSTIVFWKDHMYFIGSDGKAEVYQLQEFGNNGRFTFAGDLLSGKAIVVQENKDCLRLFMNHKDKREQAVKDPEAKSGSCDQMFECAMLSTDEAGQRLSRAGVRIDFGR